MNKTWGAVRMRAGKEKMNETRECVLKLGQKYVSKINYTNQFKNRIDNYTIFFNIPSMSSHLFCCCFSFSFHAILLTYTLFLLTMFVMTSFFSFFLQFWYRVSGIDWKVQCEKRYITCI